MPEAARPHSSAEISARFIHELIIASFVPRGSCTPRNTTFSHFPPSYSIVWAVWAPRCSGPGQCCAAADSATAAAAVARMARAADRQLRLSQSVRGRPGGDAGGAVSSALPCSGAGAAGATLGARRSLRHARPLTRAAAMTRGKRANEVYEGGVLAGAAPLEGRSQVADAVRASSDRLDRIARRTRARGLLLLPRAMYS